LIAGNLEKIISLIYSWGVAPSWIGALMGTLTSFYIPRLVGDVAVKKVIRNQKKLNLSDMREKRGAFT
jgi:uncharacterized membrane protein YdjX (TVP38/TMEM64 family)